MTNYAELKKLMGWIELYQCEQPLLKLGYTVPDPRLPDFCLPADSGDNNGLYLVFKKEEALDEASQLILAQLVFEGYAVGLVNDWESARYAVMEYLDREDPDKSESTQSDIPGGALLN